MPASDPPERPEDVAKWLLHRVAQSVEAGEVSGELVTHLHAELASARERPEEEGYAMAVEHLAELTGLPQEEAAKILAAIERQPSGTRRLLLGRLVEVWLEGQRRAYRKAEGM